MSEQMKKDVKQQAEVQHTKAQELHTGGVNGGEVKKTGIEANKGYVKVSRGYPVQPGQTWHDLTPAQRKEWFTNHESRWKKAYGLQAGQATGAPASMDWTRG